MLKSMNKIKPHIPAMVIIIVCILIVFSPFIIFNWDKIWYGDMYSYRYRMELTKISIIKYHDFLPLWSPYTMSGAPFFGRLDADIGFFYISYPLLIFFSPTVALKLSYILSIILAGIGMYLLAIYLKLERRYAFLSAIIYVFNGWFYTRFRYGHLTTIAQYSLTPFIMLYFFKSFKEENWVKNSIITGVLFALQIHGGPDLKVTLWLIPVIVIYALFSLMGHLSIKQIKKTIGIGILMVLVTFGLSAIKILPAKEYLDLGSRANLDFQKAQSQRVEWKNIFQDLVEPIPPQMFYKPGVHYNVGIIVFLLALFAIFKRYKNKMVLFLTSIAILSVFLATGSFVFYLFWRYIPYYGSFRYPSRILSIYVFAMALLAAIGASLIFSKLQAKFRWSSKKASVLYVVLIMLILVNNVIFAVSPYRLNYTWRNPDEVLAGNHILQYLGKQPGIFRMHTYETRGIDQGTEFQNVPLGLQSLYGYDVSWLVEYMNVYLSVALQNPAKLWGILNTKYLTSQTELNLTGFKFIKKFDKCEECFPDVEGIQKIWGPYLYENELFLPRAYITNSSILVLGKKDNVMQIIYGLMLDDRFNPSNAVIIQGKEKINEYNIGELKRYNAIFLAPGSIDSNSVYLLKDYADNGGILIPDVIKGEQTITDEKLRKMWGSLNGNFTPIEDKDHILINFDERKLNVNGKKGFLVYSEILTFYHGWKALADGKQKEIYRANGVIGAIYLDSPTNEVTLEFKPKSFVIGSWITVISLLVVIAYFVRMKMKKPNKTQEQKNE